MSQYLILIYEDEAQYATASPEVMGEVMEEHNASRPASRGTARAGRRRGAAADRHGDQRPPAARR
jgi:hypothetical protein